jgi:uncharacterized protein (TIGR03435 family)
LFFGAAGIAAVAALLIFSAADASPHATPRLARAQQQSQTQTKIAALTPAENCAQNAVPQPVTEHGAKVKGFRYSSVCVRPYKPDPEYARLETPSGETRDGFSIRNASPLWIIQVAYGSGIGKVFGVPDWLNGADAYDFEAKMEPATAAALEKLRPDDQKIARLYMMQALLADEFKLKVHKETREIAAYNLVVAEGGPKLHEVAADPKYPDGYCMILEAGANAIIDCRPGRLDWLLGQLEFFMTHPVIDKTGLTGWYKYSVQFRSTPEAWVKTHPIEEKDTLPHAIADQLGLLLQPTTIQTEVIVIDHVERPSGN